ncbi:DUF4304 domain-containing protein [Roseimicrobium gellanilyticum]|uniref:DUF4304 domain-containing protein n=1 Tax=Roseimicrobium gellanilyticum TaxID=748857 RepID=UPI000DE951B6|nr:DUF4304 domain-containing protein [Roseimicrobium gellanilyticum]
MSEARDKMVSVLRKVVIPKLREMGFRGSFPHFRRAGAKQLDLLTFQFSQWSSSFVVELGWCSASGHTMRDGTHYPPDRVRPCHLHRLRQRVRLGAESPDVTDHWFKFEPDKDRVRMDAALEVLSLLESQGERFWKEHIPY